MDIDVFKRGFKLVEYIYDNQIQDLELFRIRDVGNSLEESHWRGKQWLVDKLSEFLYNEDVVRLNRLFAKKKISQYKNNFF